MGIRESIHMPRVEGRHVFWGGIAVFMGFMVVAAINSVNHPTPRQELVPLPTPTVALEQTLSSDELSQGNDVLYPYTGIRYLRTNPPDGMLDWQSCLAVPQGGTLYGATMSLGESPTVLADVARVRVYPNSRFGRTQPEEFDPVFGVPNNVGGILATELWADTIVCGR